MQDLPSSSAMLIVAVESEPNSPPTGLLRMTVKLSGRSWMESSTVIKEISCVVVPAGNVIVVIFGV